MLPLATDVPFTVVPISTELEALTPRTVLIDPPLKVVPVCALLMNGAVELHLKSTFVNVRLFAVGRKHVAGGMLSNETSNMLSLSPTDVVNPLVPSLPELPSYWPNTRNL